jgi:hypothetical protein
LPIRDGPSALDSLAGTGDGATPELADELFPWALAVHFKKTTLSKAYDWPVCRVPVFDDLWR